MAFVIIDKNKQNTMFLEPKKPQVRMLMKVFRDEGKKQTVDGRKYDLISCNAIEVISTLE